jgi:hypothetical protein
MAAGTCRTNAGPIDHEALVADASIRTMPFKGRIIGTLSFRIFIRAHALFAGRTGRRHLYYLGRYRLESYSCSSTHIDVIVSLRPAEAP